MLALVTTAPQALREQLRELTITELVEVAAAFRFHDDPDTIVHTTKYTLRELALPDEWVGHIPPAEHEEDYYRQTAPTEAREIKPASLR